MEPMGWLVRRITLTAVHPTTGAIIVWKKIVISDGNGGTIFEDQDFNQKRTVPSNDLKSLMSITIFPNPTSEYIYLNTHNFKGTKVNISLYDINFRNVSLLYNDYVNSENLQLLIPNLPSGNYFITLNDGISVISKSISIIK
ncbi:MAG: T9SS type A sorting domain-containing protein [Ignavibacteriae bacterium]|nr:T9SS type A sorting domain-containing protein [Ignavibacteriota bacterium]